ncbi:hypothetical protein EUGRSUZ_B03268 [Eucalyptus grandis]|uniref:Uncharacterized protein n=2 Tax=Eucalyptus grandis TaxID=71139 RepID=A0ACC3LWJ5_EUCGR|nr:hypothetical protein EUGRSUZ_B03268 [Eucalyptus grandis]
MEEFIEIVEIPKQKLFLFLILRAHRVVDNLSPNLKSIASRLSSCHVSAALLYSLGFGFCFCVCFSSKCSMAGFYPMSRTK